MKTSKKKPTVISLFAGGGGSSLGYHQAGFKELLAIDFDDNAVKTFEANFDTPIWKRDIRKVTSGEILKFSGLKKGELDLLDGSPPCQGFSTAGKRILVDKRNELYAEFLRLVNELQPKVFVMENVKGLVIGSMKGKFKEIMLAAKATNYNVRCKLMNSKHYGVAQSRERLIWIGVRKDIKIESSFPKPSSRISSILSVINGITTKTCIWLKPEWYTYKMWYATKIGSSFARSAGKKSGYSFCKPNPYKPCPTIQKSLRIGNRQWGAFVHWKEQRTLSIEEIKRISSFPNDFVLFGNITKQWAIIGNSVMPKFMYNIAKHIKRKILWQNQVNH